MTKEELMQLVDETSSNKTISEFVRSRKKLSKALDAALKQARMDALEEAVEYALDACDSWARNNWQLKDAIRALKGTK